MESLKGTAADYIGNQQKAYPNILAPKLEAQPNWIFSIPQDQRNEFVSIFKDSLLDNYASTLAKWGDSSITTIFPENDQLDFEKNIEVKQILDTGTSKYPISYKLRKNKEGWKIVNIIINGLNLGLTLRNQFQALALSSDEDIEITIKNWNSDFGDAGIS